MRVHERLQRACEPHARSRTHRPDFLFRREVSEAGPELPGEVADVAAKVDALLRGLNI